jgi:hypothetical protein
MSSSRGSQADANRALHRRETTPGLPAAQAGFAEVAQVLGQKRFGFPVGGDEIDCFTGYRYHDSVLKRPSIRRDCSIASK